MTEFPFSAVMRAVPQHFIKHDTEGRTPSNIPTVQSFAECVGYSRSTVERWIAGQPLDWIAADRVAIANNMHPSQIWPEEWATMLADQLVKSCVDCTTEKDVSEFRVDTNSSKLVKSRCKECMSEAI